MIRNHFFTEHFIEIIIYLHAVIRHNRDPVFALPRFPYIIFQDYSTIKNRILVLIQNTYLIQIFPALRVFMCVYVCVCANLGLYNYHMNRFAQPPQQSRYRKVPSTQGSLMIPFISIHTCLLSSPQCKPLSYISKNWHFKLYVSGTMPYVTFEISFLKTLIPWRLIQFVGCNNSLLLCIAEQCCIVHQFVRAAITKSQKLGGLGKRIVSQFWRLKVKNQSVF